MTSLGALDAALLPYALGGLAFLAVLVVVLLTQGGQQQKQLKRRLERVKRQPDKTAPARKELTVRRSTADSSIAAIDQLIKRMLPNVAKLRGRLAATGRKITIGQYLFGCLMTLAMSAVIVKVAFRLPGPAALAIGVMIGIGLPHVWIRLMIGRRIKRFTALFPEAIDLIIRGLKSGLPVSESVRMVGQEIKDPVGVEFRLISDSVKFGMTLVDALLATAQRIDTPEFRFFIIALSIQQETGGNLAETLENLNNVLRRRRQMHLKIKAFSSEAKASAYIIGSLPFLMFGIILLMNYGYAIQLFTDPRGLVMVGVGLMSYVMGIAVMWKMVRFDI